MWTSRIRWFLTSALVVATLIGPGLARAEVDPNFSRRDDDSLEHLVEQLEAKAAKRGELRQAARVTLLRDDFYSCALEAHELICNTIVKLGHAPEGTYERSFVLATGAEVADAAVWILHDGKLKRPDATLWSQEERDERQRLVFRVPDLEEGDVVGLSFNEKHGHVFGGALVPLWEDDPVLMTRLRVGGTKEIAFRIEGWNLVRDKWSIKPFEERGGMAVDQRFTTANIPAAGTVSADEPAWSELPFLLVTPRGRWLDHLNSWYEATSWNEIAVRASRMMETTDEDVAAFRTRAELVVGGETDPVARAAALHDWIQENYETSDPFDRGRPRGELTDLLERRTASRRGRVMLLYALGRSLGLEFEVLATRGRDFGTLRRGVPEMAQFTDLILRVPGTEPRYYCPYGGDGAAGEVPTNLHGCDAMLVKPGLRQAMEELQREVMKAGAASPEAGMQIYREKVREADFAVWEKLP